jgi:ABC-type phosphate transport system substrate-binding protein
MRYTRSTSLTAFATTVWLTMLILPAGAHGGKRSDPIVLRGAGSTFASPLDRKWTETYRSAYPNVSITYDAVGSGESYAGDWVTRSIRRRGEPAFQ